MNISNIITPYIKIVVKDILNQNYKNIINNNMNGHFSLKDFCFIFDEYTDVFTFPPEESYLKLDIYQYNDNSGYGLDFPLWINSRESD